MAMMLLRKHLRHNVIFIYFLLIIMAGICILFYEFINLRQTSFNVFD